MSGRVDGVAPWDQPTQSPVGAGEEAPSRVVVSSNPPSVCGSLRDYLWKAREPFARFFRMFYVKGKSFSPRLLRDSSPETHLWPAPPPVAPEAAGLRPCPNSKMIADIGLRSTQRFFWLVLFFAAASFLALGEPKKLYPEEEIDDEEEELPQ